MTQHLGNALCALGRGILIQGKIARDKSVVSPCAPEERPRGLVDAPDVLQGALAQLQLKEVPELRLVDLQAGLAHHHTHRPLHLRTHRVRLIFSMRAYKSG